MNSALPRFAISILCAAASALAQPSVTAVLNAASQVMPEMPNAGVAQGSIVLITGAGLGPADAVKSAGVPLPTDLASVSVKITARGATWAAPLVSVSATQITAILPSTTPVGEGSVTVTYNGRSTPAAVRVVPTRFGIFARSGAGGGPARVLQPAADPTADPFNSVVNAVAPGTVVTIYGTGLGGVTGDLDPSVSAVSIDLTVLVGNKSATVLSAGRSPDTPGLDLIKVRLPSDAPEGCYVPLAVKAGGVVSNFTSISISNSSTVCDVKGLFSAEDLQNAAAGQNLHAGIITMGRTRLHIVAPIIGTIDGKLDTGTAAFLNLDPGTLASARGLGAGFGLAPFGTCTVFPFKTQGTLDEVVALPGLDAGAAISVKGPAGTKELAGTARGYYIGNVGGTLPALPGLPGGGSNLPDYLDPGVYTMDNGSGGSDVGAFSATLQIDGPMTWTNRDAITRVPRTDPLTVTWSGGTTNQFVVITGLSPAPGTGGAGFNCTERADAGTFTVPADVLSLLPVSATIFGSPTGTLTLSTTLLVGNDKPKAPGLDLLIVNYSDASTMTLGYQ